MKKPIIIGAMVIIFALAVYYFEKGEKDPTVNNNEAPSHVKG